MYLLRSELHLSFPRIANELGRKDHTTAIHSVEKISKAVKLDFVIREPVADVRERLYGATRLLQKTNLTLLVKDITSHLPPTSSATSSHIYTTLTTHFSQPYSGKLTGLSKGGYPLLHNPYYYYYYFV